MQRLGLLLLFRTEKQTRELYNRRILFCLTMHGKNTLCTDQDLPDQMNFSHVNI
jgi:hypothetical protein